MILCGDCGKQRSMCMTCIEDVFSIMAITEEDSHEQAETTRPESHQTYPLSEA